MRADRQLISFAGSSVMKVGCVDPTAPPGQQQYIVLASLAVTATTLARAPTTPTFTGTLDFQFASETTDKPFTGTGGAIIFTCTEIERVSYPVKDVSVQRLGRDHRQLPTANRHTAIR